MNHSAATRIIASASRRARNLPKPFAVRALSLAMVPRVWAPSMAMPPDSGGGGGALPRSHAHNRAGTWRLMIKGSISTAMTRMRPRKAGTAPAGNWLVAFTVMSTPSTLMTRVVGQPSRNTLLIRTVSTAPRQLPITRPLPPRIEAPPIMTEAITMSSALRPNCEVTPLSWAMAMSPASVAHSDDMR